MYTFNTDILNRTIIIPNDVGDKIGTVPFLIKQLYHFYPSLRPFFFDFETKMDLRPLFYSFQEHSTLVWITYIFLCLLYVFILFFGQRIMRDRKPAQIRKYLIFWNFFLFIFSLMGTIRLVPNLLNHVITGGLKFSVCTSIEYISGHGAAGLWLTLFVFSKIPEFVDTFFLVLRKREVIFLHWYHHITVALYCIHSFLTVTSVGVHFAAMNYFVHALMYFYYFLTSIGYRPKFDKLVTFLQISQMFFGLYIILAHYYYSDSPYCYLNLSNFYFGFLMYLSYFILFIILALERYCKITMPWSKKEKPKEKEKIN